MKTKQILKVIGITIMVLSLGWMVIKCAYGVGLAEGYRKGMINAKQEYEVPNSRNIENLLKNINLTIEDAKVYFDEIDELVKNGTNEDDAVEIVFNRNNKHENNPFGDVSTLMDYYNIYNGEYDDSDLMACERALDALQDKYSEDIEKAFQEGKESILEQF